LEWQKGAPHPVRLSFSSIFWDTRCQNGASAGTAPTAMGPCPPSQLKNVNIPAVFFHNLFGQYSSM
jgi:hypothetical protein